MTRTPSWRSSERIVVTVEIMVWYVPLGNVSSVGGQDSKLRVAQDGHGCLVCGRRRGDDLLGEGKGLCDGKELRLRVAGDPGAGELVHERRTKRHV